MGDFRIIAVFELLLNHMKFIICTLHENIEFNINSVYKVFIEVLQNLIKKIKIAPYRK